MTARQMRVTPRSQQFLGHGIAVMLCIYSVSEGFRSARMLTHGGSSTTHGEPQGADRRESGDLAIWEMTVFGEWCPEMV